MSTPSPQEHETEFEHSGWKNPYVLYILLVLGIFFFLVLMAYLAVHNGWLPNRGTTS